MNQLWDSERGLTTEEAAARRAKYGTNEIVESTQHPWWGLLLETGKYPMLWFFAGTSALYAIVGQQTEALTLMVAILPLIGMDETQSLSPRNPAVLRASVAHANGTELSLSRFIITRFALCRGFINRSNFLGLRFFFRGSMRSGRLEIGDAMNNSFHRRTRSNRCSAEFAR